MAGVWQHPQITIGNVLIDLDRMCQRYQVLIATDDQRWTFNLRAEQEDNWSSAGAIVLVISSLCFLVSLQITESFS